MSDDYKRVHILVSGLVQGVFFRAYTRKIAAEHKLTGWVRNLSDGRVEIMAEGRENMLQKLVDWAKKGSPNAKVQKVQFQWLPYSGEFSSFEIRPTAQKPEVNE